MGNTQQQLNGALFSSHLDGLYHSAAVVGVATTKDTHKCRIFSAFFPHNTLALYFVIQVGSPSLTHSETWLNLVEISRHKMAALELLFSFGGASRNFTAQFRISTEFRRFLATFALFSPFLAQFYVEDSISLHLVGVSQSLA